MFDNLEKLESDFKEIEEKIYGGSFENSENYASLMKDFKKNAPIVEKYKDYKKKSNEIEKLKLLIKDDEDVELKKMAEEELEILNSELEKIKEELIIFLSPKNSDDEENVVIIEIRGGTGGEEASLFCAVLLRMYTMYAQRKNWKLEIISSHETGLGGYKEICFTISGKGAFSRLKYESGVHRVQRVPETESSGRVHTSTVTIAVLLEAEDAKIEVNNADLNIDTFRASGAGGQHVNKTESAIRITHIPTGLVVECQDERSQYKNKERAMKILKSKLLEQAKNKQKQTTAEERKTQVGTGDRSERIRTYNYAQNRVTDHRIGLSIYRLEEILNGDIDELINSLVSKESKG
ncbi:MAG: peptide chain release factor 1 [Candidatus Improbicoccus pseudotrichonymphae]|uniref:Peptide chain release factor 1 n=1 Tax=Candidatus Improbicoccus pseudotrichonymphae TaxID=3033792 RepID=A0AA48KZ32_9FIRM|nr:MAG: peptide chain release factor 1 [Candidatus Improbicoccus pseudotrichonymphae]